MHPLTTYDQYRSFDHLQNDPIMSALALSTLQVQVTIQVSSSSSSKKKEYISNHRSSNKDYYPVCPSVSPYSPCESPPCGDSSGDIQYSSPRSPATFTRTRIHRSRSYITEAPSNGKGKTRRKGSLTFATSVNDFPRAGASRRLSAAHGADSTPRYPRRASTDF
jgi:hypothetical protein